MRYAFAGDRDIAVAVLDLLLEHGSRPEALLISGPPRASHAHELVQRCPFLSPERVFRGGEFREDRAVSALRALEVDFIIGVHFPYIVPPDVLRAPRQGVLNLHPAFLPYNRGWHTPSWALLEGTPIGATLHFMDEGVDTGDVVNQRRLDPSPGDTADTLYRRVKALELEVFRESLPRLVAGDYPRVPQAPAEGTFHRRKDLFDPAIQRLDMGAATTAGELLLRLRALTTSLPDEAAYFDSDGRRFRVQVRITEEYND